MIFFCRSYCRCKWIFLNYQCHIGLWWHRPGFSNLLPMVDPKGAALVVTQILASSHCCCLSPVPHPHHLLLNAATDKYSLLTVHCQLLAIDSVSLPQFPLNAHGWNTEPCPSSDGFIFLKGRCNKCLYMRHIIMNIMFVKCLLWSL